MMEEIELDGYKISFDEKDGSPTNNISAHDWIVAEWNGITQNYIKRYNVQSDWNIVIAGGWIGLDTVVFAKKCKMVYTLEPFPDSYNKIVKNCRNNNVYNVTLIPMAFSNKNILESGYIVDGSGANGINLNYPQNKVIGNIDITSITWDTFINLYEIKQVDLCIIDIEGAEERFMEGMTKVLPKRLFMSIYHPSNDWGRLRDLVKNKGYHLVPPHIMVDGRTHSEVNEL